MHTYGGVVVIVMVVVISWIGCGGSDVVGWLRQVGCGGSDM